MIRCIRFIWLILWCCQLPRLATAQAIVSHPLPLNVSPPPATSFFVADSSVVLLEPGDCLDRELVGMEPALYQQVREELALGRQTVAAGDVHQRVITRTLVAADSTGEQARRELLRCRDEGLQKDKRYESLLKATHQAITLPSPPLLLNPAFYKGTAVGVLLTLLFHFSFK